jgi:hypothetical protein
MIGSLFAYLAALSVITSAIADNSVARQFINVNGRAILAVRETFINYQIWQV